MRVSVFGGIVLAAVSALFWSGEMAGLPGPSAVIVGWVGLLALLALLIPLPKSVGDLRTGSNRLILLSFLPILAIFIFGFGSGHGTFRQGFLAIGLAYVASLIAVAAAGGPIMRMVGSAALSIGLVFSLTLIVLDGRGSPLTIDPISSQTESTFLMFQERPLKLSEGEASVYGGLIRDAQGAGWVRGTQLVDLTRWGFILPLVLDSSTPSTLTLGLDWQVEWVALSLEEQESLGFNFESSWLATSTHEFISEEDVRNQGLILKNVENFTGREFPEGYDRVSSRGGFELWKPRVE